MRKQRALIPVEQRFWAKVVCLLGDDSCWEWTGAQQPLGYGLLAVNRVATLAHRISYEIANGVTLKPDQIVCHSCDNPKCVNPGHLWLGTVAMNNADRHAKGRSRGARHIGEQNPCSKLTADQVREIRSAQGTQAEIAQRFGIVFQTVSDIRRGRIWRHVT